MPGGPGKLVLEYICHFLLNREIFRALSTLLVIESDLILPKMDIQAKEPQAMHGSDMQFPQELGNNLLKNKTKRAPVACPAGGAVIPGNAPA